MGGEALGPWSLDALEKGDARGMRQKWADGWVGEHPLRGKAWGSTHGGETRKGDNS